MMYLKQQIHRNLVCTLLKLVDGALKTSIKLNKLALVKKSKLTSTVLCKT